ncbi:MAG: hypothetical protein P8Y53_00760 [Pseudolabrys sp.]
MAEDIAGGGEAAKPPEAGRPRQGADGELPAVESPSLSPAGGEPETVPESAIVVLPPIAEAGTQAARPRFRLRSRHRRQAMLAAAVAIAAALGALATGGKGAAPAAAAGEQRALQQSVSRLGKEVASWRQDWRPRASRPRARSPR